MNIRDPNNRREVAGSLATFLICVLPWLVMSQSIAIPNSNLQTEGNSSSRYPFSLPGFTVRYQQVYDSSQFSLATNGGWIYWLIFRADGLSSGFTATASDIEIHLSTTKRSPDGLSPVFSENIGPDDDLVYSGSLNLGGPVSGDSPESWLLDLNQITLSKYFWYDPRLGNLLLDVRAYQGVTSLIPAMDAAAGLDNGVSSVTAFDVTATSGTTNASGLVTSITMAPVPTLQAYVSNFGTATNYIAIRWPAQPNGFILQQSDSLADDSAWQSLPGVGGPNLVFKEYRIPVASAGPAAFFRLVRPGWP